MKVLILKNVSREGPGLLQEILDEYKISYDIVDLDIKERIPGTDGYSAIFVLGGGDSANDDSDKIKEELAYIQKVIENGIPYLGICLGMQVLVKACGGDVHKNDVAEIGWKDENAEYFSIDILDEKISDSLFTGLENSLNIFHLHGETVDITDEMELLATGKFCKNQIVKIGTNAYGFQGHFELTPGMFEEWINNDDELKMLDKDELIRDFDIMYNAYQKTGRKIFKNFLKIANLL
jgi:GMP synthase-like glutamine amidotransferase